MPTSLSDADRELLKRFFEVVLVRYRTGEAALSEACEDLVQAFTALGGAPDDFRTYLQTAIEDHR